MNPYRGVLVPDDMREDKRDEYVEKVKRGNRAFIDACFALEDEAQRLGVTLDES